MRRRPAIRALLLTTLFLVFVPANAGAALTPVMSGLDNPRGLAEGPFSSLYVAEAGVGGAGPCTAGFPPPPFQTVECYGPSGAVSQLLFGSQQRIATGLPSHAPAGGFGATGPHDVAYGGPSSGRTTILCHLNQTMPAELCPLYIVTGWGANPALRAAFGSVGSQFGRLARLVGGGAEYLADIAAYEAAANPDGGPVDSNPYSLILDGSSAIVAEAGGNNLLRVPFSGAISNLAVFPSRPSGRNVDAVPTSVTQSVGGAFYVGELASEQPGAARVYRLLPQGPEVFLSGFTSIIDIDFGADGSLYVLEFDPGRLTRVAPNGTRTVLASAGLVTPTSVLVVEPSGFGPSNPGIYVSNFGVFPDIGQVVRVDPDLPASESSATPEEVAGTTSSGADTAAVPTGRAGARPAPTAI